MESKTLPNLKPLSKMQEMNLRSLKLKEESISTLLTTIKSNQKFAKLLIFTLNSLRGFVSPPNREIRINASIIINLNGLDVLHLISVINITKDEIISLAGDIFYKLIYINDIFDKELAKLFAEKNGHKLIIDIVLKRSNEKNNNILLLYIKIINGLTQIPQLIPNLIESNIIDAVNLNLDENEQNITYDKIILQTKLDTLKQISTPKIGRDYLIKNNYAKKIINTLNKCTEKKDIESVLSGLGILENLCRNEEGLKELKNSDIINCLSYVCNLLGYSQSIMKMNAKIYCKIASVEDLKTQLDLLKKNYEENKSSDNYQTNFKNINSSLELVSNFILVDELCLILKEEEYFELLKNLFIQIQQINLENRRKEFINLFISIGKNFMNIFYRLFSLVPTLMENNEEIIKHILNSIMKNWDIVYKNIEDKNNLMTFNSFFTSYGEIFNQYVVNNPDKLKNEIVDNLIFINKNILILGETYLNLDENNITPHRIACILMKICNEISIKSSKENNVIEKKDELIQSLEECYPYLEFLFTKTEDEEILSYVLELIYDLVNSKKEFKENKLSQIIDKICDFMLKKNNQRYPCLQCMKLLDIFISQENDINKDTTQKIKYIDSIVNVMTFNDLDINIDEKKKKIENEINLLGSQILEKLLDEEDFNKLLKDFCDTAEKYAPYANNKELTSTLENYIKRITGIIEVKNYFELGANLILTSLKTLVEKEIKHIEFYKKDKTNEKNPDFYIILENTSSRILSELNLDLKLSKISQKKNNFEIYIKTLDIIFSTLTKSTDKKNTKYLLNNLKSDYSYIITNESNIKLPNNENIIQKIINVKISLLKKMVEEDDIVFTLLNNLLYLAQKNNNYCNHIIKAGAVRLLLQIIENSPNEQNVQIALELLKLICGSNEDNLKMLSSQNAMNVFFQAKKKFEGNNILIQSCNDISNDILILPEQESYASDLISENINLFNINSKKDFSDNNVRAQLLSSLQIINSFVSNQTQADVINKNEEFLENFKEVTNKTLKEKELDSINEKLVNSELSLINKINKSDHKYFGFDYIIDKSIDIIKNKSRYQDILIKTTNEFLKYLSVQSLYEKHISSKMDTAFIDCVFDNIDNYLNNIQETRDLNSILFYLCLYNEEFSSYIKKKGGLKNVYEDLKSTIDSNNKESNATKLNSLKMLYSLCNDKNELSSFVKSGGIELLNKITESEIESFKDYLKSFNKDLFKVREITTNEDEVSDKNIDNENNVAIYNTKLLLKIISSDDQYFNNKIINELIFLSEANYPIKDIFLELCQFLLKDDKYLPTDENYLFLLLKNTICLKGKYYSNKEFVTNVVDKLQKLILPKIFESNNYFANLSKSLEENSNKPLQLCYLSKIISYYDKINPDKQIQIFGEIEKFVVDYIKYYKDKESKNIKEGISTNIVISLLNVAIYILKYKKTDIKDIVDNINIFIFMCQQILFKKGYESFTHQFMTKCNLIFENAGQNNNRSPNYIKYLNSIIPKSIELLTNIHQNISTENKYTSIEETIAHIFDLLLVYLKDIFSAICDEESINNITKIKFEVLFNLICDLINDFNKVQEINEDKRNDIIEDLYKIILGLISKVAFFTDNDNLTPYQNTVFRLLDYMNATKNKLGVFPKIVNNIINKTDSSQDLFDKSINLILNDFNASPYNLDSLTLLTKDVNKLRNLIGNKNFSSAIISLYAEKDNLALTQRKNIITVYTNLFKNTYNTELIMNKNPDLIKSVIVESEKEKKEESNLESQKNDLNILVSILKDNNNANQLLEKKIVTKENINNIINRYENSNDNTINEHLNELKNIYEYLDNYDNNDDANEDKNDDSEKKDLFQSEKSLLVNLKEKIDKAYEEHLKLLNKSFNENEFKNNFDDQVSDIIDLTSINKKRKLSITSDIILNNSLENKKITSPISTSSNDEMSSSLDNLISLIRLLHLKYKTSSDKEIIKERIGLIKQSFYLLKKYTICPENHKAIIDAGLISFIEKLIIKEEYQIYLSALEVLKNCTYSENAVEDFLLSIYYEIFIEEISGFYENMSTVNENKENRECFYYDNIILDNIIKTNQGFESILNNLGFDKVLLIAKNTGNANMWYSTIVYLNNKTKDPKEKKEELIDKLINDILVLAKKVFDVNPDEMKENLLSETLNLLANVYNKKNEESFNKLNIVNILNATFDKFKNNNEYLVNIIFLLQAICSDNKIYYNQIVETNLISKICEQMAQIEQKDDLINNFSNFLCNILTKKENEKNLCTNEIINHIFYFVNKYSQKLDVSNDNKNTVGQSNENKENKNANLNESKDDIKVYNSILNNYLKIINYFSSDEKNTEIVNEKYHDTLFNAIKKAKLDVNNTIRCLICLNYYYTKTPKEQWNTENIQNLYVTLNTLKETYYSTNDLLINTLATLVGVILNGVTVKFLIERFYSLLLDSINSQDWNETLVTSTLVVLKDCLIKNDDLQNDVFENTQRIILNLLKLYPNSYLIILNGYDLLTIFVKNNAFAQALVNADLISLIRSSLVNKSFNVDNEKEAQMKLMIYKLLYYLSNIHDKDINGKISLELMDCFVNDLKVDAFSEYLNEIAKILINIFKDKLAVETLILKSGLDSLSSCLDKFYENKIFILNVIIILRDIMFSSNENKDKIKNGGFKEKIQNILDNTDDKFKKLKMEGKIIIYNLNYIKKEKAQENKNKKLLFKDYIDKENMLKNNIHSFMTRGIPIKAQNPKGKIKEFILCFSPDLMKIYLKKPKIGNIPPKAKYTLETPLIKNVVQNYTIKNFKKSGVINKAPDKQLCFAIEQELIKGQKTPKTLAIVCFNNDEANLIWGCVELIVDYIKNKCWKSYSCKIKDFKEFFKDIMWEQLNSKNFDIKKTVFLKSKMK